MFPLGGNADVSGWDVGGHQLDAVAGFAIGAEPRKFDAVAGLGAEPRKIWPFFAYKRTVGT